MKQLANDLKTLMLKNWKSILMIALIIYLISNFTDIKQGIRDGWLNK